MPLNSSVVCEAKVDMESSSEWNNFNGFVTLGGKHTTKRKKESCEKQTKANSANHYTQVIEKNKSWMFLKCCYYLFTITTLHIT